MPIPFPADWPLWGQRMSGGGGLGPFTGASTLSEMQRMNARPLYGPATYPRLRGTNIGGVYVGYVSRGGSHVYDSFDAPLANRVEEFGDNCGERAHPDVELGMAGCWSQHWIMDTWFSMDGIRQAGGLAANRMMGWQVGSHQADPPFAAAPAMPVIQVRLSLRPGIDDITLYVSKGDGVTPATEQRIHLGQESGVTGLQAQYNAGKRIRLEHAPGQFVRLTTWDAFDGKFKSVQVSDPTFPSSAYATGWGIFSYTGAGVCGNQFSMSHGWIYTLRSDWGIA